MTSSPASLVSSRAGTSDLENAADHDHPARLLPYLQYAPAAIWLYTLFAALSIAMSQILVVGITLWWLSQAREPYRLPRLEQRSIAALLLFLGCALAAALLGLNPGRALVDLLKLGFAFLFPFAVAATLDERALEVDAVPQRLEFYVSGFALGQFLAAMHSVGSLYYGQELPIGIPGAVTESGQLVLIVTLLLALSLRCYSGTPRQAQLSFWAQTAALFAFVAVVAWPQVFGLVARGAIHRVVVFLLFAYTAIALLKKRRSLTGAGRGFWQEAALFFSLKSLTLGILLGVFLSNLKRGPWVGCLLALILFGLFYSKKLVYASIATACLLVAFVEPVQQRLLALAAHFSIAGGRKNMWEIGSELIQRFPMGLGLDNARFMREVDPSLPDLHRHMHNNILNIAVETGFLGLLAYIWWFLLLCSIAYAVHRSSVSTAVSYKIKIWAVALACALIGWQISGFVEYNFGDGEIRLIAFSCIGFLIAIHRQVEHSLKRSTLARAEE